MSRALEGVKKDAHCSIFWAENPIEEHVKTKTMCNVHDGRLGSKWIHRPCTSIDDPELSNLSSMATGYSRARPDIPSTRWLTHSTYVKNFAI